MYDVIFRKRSSQVMLHAPGDPAAGDGAQGRAQSLALGEQLRQGDRKGTSGTKAGSRSRCCAASHVLPNSHPGQADSPCHLHKGSGELASQPETKSHEAQPPVLTYPVQYHNVSYSGVRALQKHTCVGTHTAHPHVCTRVCLGTPAPHTPIQPVTQLCASLRAGLPMVTEV